MTKKSIPASDQFRRLLRQSGIKAKRGLGQNFLIDETVLEKIVSAAELSPEDTVIEVGPGLGILTIELARQAGKVIAVELDTKLASLLRLRLSSLSNVTIINADILELSPSQLLEKGQSSYKVVANIPYYITSPILHHFVEASPKPLLMVVMVQKEVGEAIAASPGKMSLLAASLQMYSKTSIVSYVPAQSFYPQPKVDSAIARLDLLPQPAVKTDDIDGFFKVVKYGFSSPRKQLRNSLAQGMGLKPAAVDLLLTEAKIESRRRAETLSLEEWDNLYKALTTSRKQLQC